jgi:hypothetical protein
MRGHGNPARATRGPDVLVCATRGLGFTLHRALLVYQRRHPPPALEPSRVGSSVYHPGAVACDPRNTHPIVTRCVAGVTKPADHLQLSVAAAPPTLSPVLSSVRSVLTDPHWRYAMKEYEVLLFDIMWDLVPRPPGVSVITDK